MGGSRKCICLCVCVHESTSYYMWFHLDWIIQQTKILIDWFSVFVYANITITPYKPHSNAHTHKQLQKNTRATASQHPSNHPQTF